MKIASWMLVSIFFATTAIFYFRTVDELNLKIPEIAAIPAKKLKEPQNGVTLPRERDDLAEIGEMKVKELSPEEKTEEIEEENFNSQLVRKIYTVNFPKMNGAFIYNGSIIKYKDGYLLAWRS